VLFGTLVQVGSIPAAMVIMGGVAVATAAAGRLLARGRRDRPRDATPT
jgi:hypothetical protein